MTIYGFQTVHIYFYLIAQNAHIPETILKYYKQILQKKYLMRIFFDLFILISGIPTYAIFVILLDKSPVLDYILDLGYWLKNNSIVIFIIIFVIIFGKFIIDFFKDYLILKKIYKNNLSSRKQIEKYYKQLYTEQAKIKLLNFINANYANIRGEWSDDSILRVSPNKSDIYLAQLDAKWRGIEK